MDWANILTNALRASIGLETIFFALAAIGLNVHFGYTGPAELRPGRVPRASAAYGIAITVPISGLPFWLGILVGLVGAVVLALLLGIPTLRLRADYLAIVTIAAAEIFRLFVRSVSLRDQTGGSSGLPAFVRRASTTSTRSPTGTYGFGPGSGSASGELWVLLVGWALVALSCLLVWLLMRSPWGRVLKAHPRGRGRRPQPRQERLRLQDAGAGPRRRDRRLGGFIFALGRASVQPDLYGTELTFFAYTVLILGGAARVLGPVVGRRSSGPAVLDGQRPAARRSAPAYIPTSVMTTTQVGQVRFILVGLGADAADDLPAAGHLRRQEGGGARCPLTRPRTSESDGGRDRRRRGAASRPPRSPWPASSTSPAPSKPDPILVATACTRRSAASTAVDVEHLEVQRGAITGADRPQRRRQDHAVQPAHRLRPARRRRAGPSTASSLAGVSRLQGGPARHGPHLPADQGAVPADRAGEHAARRHRAARRELCSPPWSRRSGAAQERRDHRAGRRAAAPVQARRQAGRLRRHPVRRPAQAAGDGPRADGRAARW